MTPKLLDLQCANHPKRKATTVSYGHAFCKECVKWKSKQVDNLEKKHDERLKEQAKESAENGKEKEILTHCLKCYENVNESEGTWYLVRQTRDDESKPLQLEVFDQARVIVRVCSNRHCIQVYAFTVPEKKSKQKQNRGFFRRLGDASNAFFRNDALDGLAAEVGK